MRFEIDVVGEILGALGLPMLRKSFEETAVFAHLSEQQHIRARGLQGIAKAEKFIWAQGLPAHIGILRQRIEKRDRDAGAEKPLLSQREERTRNAVAIYNCDKGLRSACFRKLRGLECEKERLERRGAIGARSNAFPLWAQPRDGGDAGSDLDLDHDGKMHLQHVQSTRRNTIAMRRWNYVKLNQEVERRRSGV